MSEEPGVRPRGDDMAAGVLDVHHAVSLDAERIDPSAVQTLAGLRLHRVSPDLRNPHASPGFRRHTLIIEAPDLAGDLVQTVLDREVSRVEPVHLRVRQVAQVRLATFGSEEDVVLTPEDDGLWLVGPEERLPCRVEVDVGG